MTHDLQLTATLTERLIVDEYLSPTQDRSVTLGTGTRVHITYNEEATNAGLMVLAADGEPDRTRHYFVGAGRLSCAIGGRLDVLVLLAKCAADWSITMLRHSVDELTGLDPYAYDLQVVQTELNRRATLAGTAT